MRRPAEPDLLNKYLLNEFINEGRKEEKYMRNMDKWPREGHFNREDKQIRLVLFSFKTPFFVFAVYITIQAQ